MKNQTTTAASKFFVVESRYDGPNERSDADRIGIYLTPAVNNGDGAACVEGWAGTTDDVTTIAHGQFDTIEAAEAKIAELYPFRRDADPDDPSGDCVAMYRPGQFATMTRSATAEWLYDAILELTGSETDNDLEAILSVSEANANDGGETLHHLALTILIDSRDAKAADIADED